MQVWNWKSENFLNHFNKDFLSNNEGFFLEFSLFIWKEILIKMIQEISGFPVSDLHFWRPYMIRGPELFEAAEALWCRDVQVVVANTGNVQSFQKTFWQEYFTVFLLIFFCWKNFSNCLVVLFGLLFFFRCSVCRFRFRPGCRWFLLFCSLRGNSVNSW